MAILSVKVINDYGFRECLAELKIPLRQIQSNEQRWYSLQTSAKNSNPKILIEFCLIFNRLRAFVQLFKEPHLTSGISSEPNTVYDIFRDLDRVKEISMRFVSIWDGVK